MIKILGRVAVSVVLLAAAFNAHATLVGTDGFSGALVSIDENTGAATQFGNIGNSLVGVAYNEQTDTWFARSFTNLYTFDLNGNSSLVGATTSATGLTFDASFSTLYSVNQGNGNFYSVDQNTGSASFLGSLGVGMYGLSTNSAGEIFGSGSGGGIYKIDVNALTATLVQNTQTLTSIAFDAADNLYGVTLSGDMLQMDLLGGAVNVGEITNNHNDLRGLAFGGAPVPAPLAAYLFLAGLAGLMIRRRV